MANNSKELCELLRSSVVDELGWDVSRVKSFGNGAAFLVAMHGRTVEVSVLDDPFDAGDTFEPDERLGRPADVDY